MHVFISKPSDARLGSFGYKIQAPEPCLEIVSQLQRIFRYPTGQGTALQTNHPPSISLPDRQAGIWLKTKSLNNNRIYKTHILHMEKLSLRSPVSTGVIPARVIPSEYCWFVSPFPSCQGLIVAYGGVKGRLNEGANRLFGLLWCNLTSERSCQLFNQRCKKGWMDTV